MANTKLTGLTAATAVSDADLLYLVTDVATTPASKKIRIDDFKESLLASSADTSLGNLASVAINTTLVSDTDNTDALGTAAIGWSDLWLGNGGVITWSTAPNTADVTLTHSENLLTLGGGNLALGSNNLTMTGSIAATDNRVTKGWFTDVEITNLPTINGGTLATALSLGTMASETATNYVAKSLFNANTVLYATDDNTPAALEVTEQTLVGRLTGGNISAVAIGIADNNILQVDDASAADNDYAKFTANGIEGVAYATVLSDIGALPLAGGTMTGALVVEYAGSGSTVPITAIIDSSNASQPALIAKNDENYAHSGNIAKLQMLNETDTGVVLKIENAGSGNYIDCDSVVTIAKNGNITTSGAIDAASMTGNIILAENDSIKLDPAGSADGKYTGITVTGTAGTTVAFGDLITLDKDDSRWELVDISAAAAATGDARGILGMAVSAGNDGDTITILLNGVIRADANFPTLTIGAAVYASTTGNVVVAQPSTTDYVIRIVGYGLTTDEIYFNPENDWISHT